MGMSQHVECFRKAGWTYPKPTHADVQRNQAYPLYTLADINRAMVQGALIADHRRFTGHPACACCKIYGNFMRC